MTTLGINRFPDEMVSNDEKKSFKFAKEYALAIWGQWNTKYGDRGCRFEEIDLYASGKHDIARLENNITNRGKLIKKEFLRYDPQDRVKFLPRLLRAYYNSVDMSQFVPVVKASDPGAMEVKAQRKQEKMKLFYAKDFIQQAAAANGGQSPIPLDQVPDSKEQVQLQEETAKPLRVERGETKALEYFALTNDFNILQKQFLQDFVKYNLAAAKVDTDPNSGIKIERIDPSDLIIGNGKDMFYKDAPYFGTVKQITVGQFRNICAESGIKYSDEDIKYFCGIPTEQKLDNSRTVRVLFYAFKTFFQEVYKKKTNRNTKALKLIDRTADLYTENEYNPKGESDISEKISDNYDVWFEGVMVIRDGAIIRHRLVQNMPEHKGRILPPYIVCEPRDVSLVEECIPKIDAIQELRLRILHHRNNLKGDITEIDPDAIANITLGDKTLSPSEVLSYYFTMGLAFRKTKDEDGEPVQNNRPLSQIPESIPRALIELTNQYIAEIQDLQNAFGAFQYDAANPDPKTLAPMEPYRLSNNTAMRDYTDALFGFSLKIYQNMSSRLNDAIRWQTVKDILMDNIGSEDMDTINQYEADRKSHYFDIYLDYTPSQQERADFIADLSAHVQTGELDALDKIELSSIRNPYQARASLRLRLDAKRKEMQGFEMQKIQESQNQNIQASNAAYENKSKLSAQEHQQKMELEAAKFRYQTFIVEKQGEITIIESNNKNNAKLQTEQFRNKFAADLTAFKKEQDAQLRKDIQQNSLEGQAQLIKLRKGEISDISQNSNVPEPDLSQLDGSNAMPNLMSAPPQSLMQQPQQQYDDSALTAPDHQMSQDDSQPTADSQQPITDNNLPITN